MSELVATLREAIAALAASDRSLQRFGAARHRYALAPPLTREAVAKLALPEDLHELVTTFAAGGAGPYYGWQLTPSAGGLVVGDLGCGYTAVVRDGAVWIDAQAAGVVRPIAPSFTAYYLDWIDRLAHDRLPEPHVPAGVCSLPAALGGFLGVHEQRLGLAPGTIDGDDLRAALAELGPGAIEIAASASLLYPDGARVAPCLRCAILLVNLGLEKHVISLPDT